MKQVAKILLVNKEGKLLLHHRSSDAKIDPDTWSFFGGKVEQHETPEQAIIREVKEEIDFNLHDFSFFKMYPFPGWDTYVFVGVVDVPLSYLHLEEGQGLGYFSLHSAKKLQLSSLVTMTLRDYFAQKVNSNFK